MTPPASPLTDALCAARRDRSLLPLAAQPVPASQAEGYAVAAAVADRLGHARAGLKVAIVEGVAAAGLMPGPWLAPGDTYEGAIGAELRLEIEIGFELAIDLPLRPDRPYARAEIGQAVGRVFVGIEIVESRLAGWFGTVAVPLWLADAMGHGGYLIGPDLPAAVLDDVSGLACLVSLNGVVLHDRPAVHGNGDPLAPVLAWANRAEEALGPLKAGQIITTGSLCGGVLVPGTGEALLRLDPLAEVGLIMR